LVAAKELAEEHGAIYLIHLCETAAEVADVIAQHGRRPVAHLESLGVLDGLVVLAHGVHVSPEEIALLAERGVSVSHCPESNMKLASGVAPVPAMLAAGLNVALGTDGAASNNDLSLWGDMRAAAMLHKVQTGDPTVVSARDALWMATRGGARALGLDAQIGSIEVGKRADLVCVRIDLPHTVPLYDPYSHLVYAAQGSDVQMVIVEGQTVYAQGGWPLLDLEEIDSRIRSMASQLVGRWARDPNWRDGIGQ
jgi:5-methylthioadenosine/S-adenosylhomocysteine deaminase